MGAPYESVKPLKNGRQLLVHFENKTYSDKLLYRTKKLIDIPVKICPHKTLNYSRCMILCRESVNMDEESIKKIVSLTYMHGCELLRAGIYPSYNEFVLLLNCNHCGKSCDISLPLLGNQYFEFVITDDYHLMLQQITIWYPGPLVSHRWLGILLNYGSF